MDHRDLEGELKRLIITRLVPDERRPADLDDDENLFDGALALDSLDGLRLVAIVEKEYGVRLGGDDEAIRDAIRSVRSLASVVRDARNVGAPR